ncbi:MAG: aspartate aminotransferase family protein [Dehalococcoidia bacterium]
MQNRDITELTGGQSLEELKRNGLDHLWFQMQQYNDVAGPDGLDIIVNGEGIYLENAEGERFIDGISGLWVVNAGHGRKEIADAVYDQIQRVNYANTFKYGNIPAIKLATKLAQITPGDLSKTFFCSGGAEAVETAIKVARQYHVNNGDRGRFKVIARRLSYHGATLGALSIAGSPILRPWLFEPLAPIGVHVDPIYCYRCPWSLEYPSCGIQCAMEVEKAIQFENPETVSAVIAEPVSISAGNVVPVPEYYPMLREICDKYGVLMIADEVITGFGRTGKMFACEHFGVVPDIMTTAKGLSSGYQPLAATIVRGQVAERFTGGDEEAFTHGITFGSHPVACAAGVANLEIFERENLAENSAKMGAYLLSQLNSLADEHPVVGDVRGLGLLCGVELVKDRQTKERFPKEARVGPRLVHKLEELGMLTRAADVLFLAPPLVIKKEEVDKMVDIVDRGLGWLEKELN